VCTAFCVGEAMIATAGHCLFNTAGERKPRLVDFWFARNYDQVRDLTRIAGHDTGAAAQNVIAGSMALKVSPPIDASSDWALVRLARPACSSVLPLRAMPAEDAVREAREGRVFQIAYHRDFRLWRQAYSKPCQVERSFPGVDWKTIAADFKAPDAILLHTCDTGGASSGSPVFVENKTGGDVIGINIGTYVQSRVVVREGPKSAATTLATPEAVANTAVAVAGFIDRVAPFKAATIIKSAAGIRDLQDALKARGHYTGAIDGSYGSGLQRAIEAYELATGLPVTGVASVALQARLKAGR
jgi:Putative peptidoglycan binding domain/Trypsin-like peptidase domain